MFNPCGREYLYYLGYTQGNMQTVSECCCGLAPVGLLCNPEKSGLIGYIIMITDDVIVVKQYKIQPWTYSVHTLFQEMLAK